MSKKKMSITILALICIICLIPITSSAAKTIKLEKGSTYKLNIKKGSTVKLSNKKVLKVNKKGKVTALKTGKCTVKVINNKKKTVYKIKVKVTASETANKRPTTQNANDIPDLNSIDISGKTANKIPANQNANDVPGSNDIDISGGITFAAQGEILKIQKKDKQYSLVVFENKDDFICGYTEKPYADKKYVIVKIKTSEISDGLDVGTKAAVILFRIRAESMDYYVIFEGTAMNESNA